MSNEATFVRELKRSIIYHAVEKGLPPPVCVKLHGSPILSSMPDILVQHKELRTLYIECKVRPEPKKGFNLYQGLTDNQKGMIRALLNAGGLVYLAVRLGNKTMLFLNLRELDAVGLVGNFEKFTINPDLVNLTPGITKHTKFKGIWSNL